MIGQYSTREDAMPAITPFLWFNDTAYEAAQFYLSLFPNSSITEHQQKPDGTTFTLKMMLDGREFQALNGGPFYTMNSAVSFMIHCKDQAEVDYYWEALTANGGEEGACGWCKDKYGLSWQVVPVEYFELINSPDAKVREKAMKNTFKQKKLILSALK